MRRLFDLIIDTLLFLGDFVCHMPSRIGNGFVYMIEVLPYKISLIYRFRRMWYPAKSDFEPHELTNEKKKWLDDNLGKYRWKIISRTENDGFNTYKKRYLCFRYETDAVAFKLRWTE